MPRSKGRPATQHGATWQPGKMYRTVAGDLVRIYAIDGCGNYSIHGAIKDDDGWRSDTWHRDGHYCEPAGSSGYDLTLTETINA